MMDKRAENTHNAKRRKTVPEGQAASFQQPSSANAEGSCQDRGQTIHTSGSGNVNIGGDNIYIAGSVFTGMLIYSLDL